MKKKAVKFFKSRKICGQLSNLVNARRCIQQRFYSGSEFAFMWLEIDSDDMFVDDDCIYCVECASGKRFEVDSWEDAAQQGFDVSFVYIV